MPFLGIKSNEFLVDLVEAERMSDWISYLLFNAVCW